MPKLPPLSPKRVIQVLLRADFFVYNQTGSHVHLRHPTKNHLRITVPRHDRFDLPDFVMLSILKQAGLSKVEFIKLFKKR